MTKKIIKISLSSLAILGICLIGVYSIFQRSETFFYNQIWSTVGIKSYNTSYTLHSQKKQPYTYINIPKSPDIPLALVINQPKPEEIKPPENNGQDITETPTQNGFPIIALDMSEGQTADRLLCKNESKYSPDINALTKNEYPLKYTQNTSTNGENAPIVLIVHTHGTECYSPEDTAFYTDSTPTRLHDKTNNVVAVGKVLADTLNSHNIPTIHCETMFDAESYSNSYTLSENAVQEYLKKYPSIQYVFDVHRDSIIRNANEKIKPLTLIDNVPTAQAMFVVGTDSKGANHPNWTNNLTIASIFQYKLVEQYSTLMRPINIRSASFNAEHAPGSILIEIGTCGNTLQEAKNCAKLLGQTIAEIIKNDGL